MQDVWNTDPAKWQAMPLVERLEAMRKWHCTGPCGQSSSVMGTRSALDATLREAVETVNTDDTIDELPGELEAIKAFREGHYEVTMGKHTAVHRTTIKRVIDRLLTIGERDAASWAIWMVWHRLNDRFRREEYERLNGRGE